jgi:hypothetical protein
VVGAEGVDDDEDDRRPWVSTLARAEEDREEHEADRGRRHGPSRAGLQLAKATQNREIRHEEGKETGAIAAR